MTIQPQNPDTYEYGLKTGGGFYNDWHVEKHGLKPGTFFFPSAEARAKFIGNLRAIEAEHNAKSLVYTAFEGQNIRYRLVAKMTLVVAGVPYQYEEDFGHGYDEKSAYFMFHIGNYACDCNLSLFLSRQYPGLVEEMDCGTEIEIQNFRCEKVYDP